MAEEPVKELSLEQIIRQTRNLLAFHRDCGLNYPLTGGIQAFLQKTQPAARPSATPAPQVTPLVASENPVSLEELRQEIHLCQRCSPGKSKGKIILGEGSEKPGCALFVVLDPPGAEEIETGQPVSGEARELLIKMLAAINLTLQDTYLTNISKCLPGQDSSAEQKISACLPFLLQQIDVHKPRIICTMGSTASRILLKTRDSLPSLRGKFHDLNGFALIPTYSPAFLLRHQEMKKGAWLDLQLIRKRLDA